MGVIRTVSHAIGQARHALNDQILFQSAAIYLPLFLQSVRGSSATGSGILIAPLMVGMAAASIYVGRRVSVTGQYRVLLLIGLIAMLGVTFGLISLDQTSTHWRSWR